MPEALKDVYDRDYIQRVAAEIAKYRKEFDQQRFAGLVFDAQWNERELKDRMQHIRVCIHSVLDLSYPEAIAVLDKAAPAFTGYAPLFFPDYVEAYGQDDWDTSIPALEWFTRFSSSELAVRPFILADPQRMMGQMYAWSKHENYHVRRLASEGCRPRLPWAQALPLFKKDPSPILPILDTLKADESEYVRRSVANNLNDIAKDNPDTVVKWAQEHIGKSPLTDWIIKHGCRTLLKQAHPEIMTLFGYDDVDEIKVLDLKVDRPEIAIGEELEFSFLLKTKANQLGKLRVEYEIGYLKANGKHSFKVFMISEGEQSANQRSFSSKRSFKPMTTRKHYPGEHWLKIRVNGVEKACLNFMLCDT